MKKKKKGVGKCILHPFFKTVESFETEQFIFLATCLYRSAPVLT